ncbi:MAG: Serine/threonine-protein kinase tel1 [Pleopsidium flavum]|nr:MAG: Serine/threonine-protein kinase tel1 [Pleopsidium flavum]
MGDVNINEAIEGVRSDKIKERIEGLADLKHILTQNRRSSQIEVLTDKGYHKIFEALFRLATNEKSVYVKAPRATTKSQSGSRLSSCAAVLRIAVEVGVRKLKPRTVKALVDHITQTLPTVNEGYCDPLSSDYVKSLRTIVDYQPHVEHLHKEEWCDLVDFCNEGTMLAEGSTGSSSSSPYGSQYILSGTRGRSGKLAGTSAKIRGDSGTQDSVNGLTKINAEELVLCLYQLTSAPNASILEKAQSILITLIDLLQSAATVGRAHQAAFATMNRILARIATNDVLLTQQTVKEVIPLIRRLWPAKSTSLRDEMLITLVYARSYILNLSKAEDGESFGAELEGLFEAVQSEYSKRAERDQLQLDDLAFLTRSRAEYKPVPLSIAGVHLRMGTTKYEQSWVIPQTIGFLVSVLAAYQTMRPENDSVADVEDSRRKRRRMVQQLDDLLRQAKNSHLTGRLCAIQVIPFVLDQTATTMEEMSRILDCLLSCISDENGTIASWAMLGIASCVYQSNAQSLDLSAQWLQIWNLAARNIPSSSACRAACHLMGVILAHDLVEYGAIADVVDGIVTSVELNGPALLVDSSLSLWSLIVEYRQRENPSATHITSERILHWLFSRWNPAKFLDRSYSAQVSQYAQPPELLDVLYVCTGRSYFPRDPELILLFGPLSQASLRSSRDHALIGYLLLPPEILYEEPGGHQQDPWWLSKNSRLGMHFHATDLLILDFCIAEIGLLSRNWNTFISERASHVSVDMIRIVSSACIVGFAITSCTDMRDSRRIEELQRLVEVLKDDIADFISRQDCGQEVVDALLEIFRQCIPPLVAQHEEKTVTRRFMSKMAPAIAQALERRRQADLAGGLENGHESSDVDDRFDSQSSHTRLDSSQRDMPRDEIAAETNLTSFRHSLSAQMYFLSIKQDHNEDVVPSLLVDYLTSLRASELLSCRPFLRQISSNHCLNRADASRLLEYLGQEVLQSYEFERCEVSMCICLDVMTGLANLWTGMAGDDLADIGAALYGWFIQVALGKGISSSSVQMRIAAMLQQLLKVRPDFARSLSLPSPRTSLFSVLKEGDIAVKFYVAENISQVFSLFVLREHDAILEDVVDSLPSERDWTEGIALRLLVLARLAASWPTLLRRSVYHMFETPGHIPESAPYAKRCLSEVSRALGLPSPRALFNLFVSQLLYTWMETQSLSAIPYVVFGYSSLADMFKDVQDEVVGQVAMRMDDGQAAELSVIMGFSFHELLTKSFDKAMAYCLGRDIGVRPSQDLKSPGAEARIRKRFSKDVYHQLISSNFPQVVANLFRSMDQEEQVEKAFGRHQYSQSALQSLNEIRGISASDITLPVNQQPSVSAKYIMDELEYLCRRTSFEMDLFWTPALFLYVFRKLLDTIHPALGSLHACSVIRRIRVLICVAGQTALQDYPLEMALHALRPFLTDSQCADDTLGLFQYLLQNSKRYLEQTPSFLVGMALSTLASLRAFLNAVQESTTQESQHRATMSKTQRFHAWFGTYLVTYDSPNFSGASERAFKAIVLSASNIRGKGNASAGTHESDLLRELLEDQQSGRNLLNRPSRDLVLRLLCADFVKPVDFRDDICGENRTAAAYAVTVWKSCQRGMCGKGYLLWAARVLGRAYASTGQIGHEMLLEAPLDKSHTYYSLPGRALGSKSAILRLLCEVLHREERLQVGLAERCLQSILARVTDAEEGSDCSEILPQSLIEALTWSPYTCPADENATSDRINLEKNVKWDPHIAVDKWIRDLTISLATTASDDAVVGALPQILLEVDWLAGQLFPHVLHVVLFREFNAQQISRQVLSSACQQWFKSCDESTISHVKLLLSAVLYLRNQPLPQETTTADRNLWLELDYAECARAAACCGMYKTALLFIEIHSCQLARPARRSSVAKVVEPTDLLLSIFKSIDEPDSFYGVQEQYSLFSIMDRLEYENAGFKSLSFRGAHFDSQLRQLNTVKAGDAEGLIKTLENLSLNGISHSLLANQHAIGSGHGTVEAMLQSARKLEQWDIPAPSTYKSEASTIFRAFQCLNSYMDPQSVINCLDSGFVDTVKQLFDGRQTASGLRSILRTLAVLAEIDEAIASRGSDQLEEAWQRLHSREVWMQTGSYADVSLILSSRETLTSALSRRSELQAIINIGPREACRLHVLALLESTRLSRSHGDLQNSLTTATYLSNLVAPYQALGIKIHAAVEYEAARVLWDQGEMTASIRMLQLLDSGIDLREQTIHVGRPELLARLGHQIAEARLEKPDEIINHYLLPAIKELKGKADGNEAGQVFHEFASFCDQQLQNSENLEDFQRIQTLRQRKEAEVRDLEKMLKSSGSEAKQKEILKGHRAKAKQWFELDDREFQRLREGRQAFLRQSLENYMLCLRACDSYDTDVLRFCALWLEQSQSEIANTAVSKHIGQVASRKFAPLMNQLSSRLLDNPDAFQSLLFALVLRICIDHPYHGMYQIFAGSKTKGGRDEMALARHSAAVNVVDQLKSSKRAGPTWIAIHNANISYVRFAAEKLDDIKFKPGSKVFLRKTTTGQRLEQDVTSQKIPPPTMKIHLRADCDYRNVPLLVKFLPEFTVASGISMPKILTAIASDGVMYKQLYKSGNDDLRQDSIMEQVFEQVSNLLQAHQASRQRNLGIRTYKVLPLTASQGIIEFVPNTIPLHDYLMPAHQKHFPKDMKPSVSRKHIADAQTKPVDTRVKVFRQVCEHFHPVMRYFFMERFDNPDDWFEKRLAYSRSTAAISILGHVLGLGDRHGHNILLDEKTGEVVHIDLGIAFEQGRVLPVPEVVPFRLTRDLVDGMGITKTEGVFRRCCEFTLDALRKESYSIMTILDVLRYDPLYSWSVSPLRLKRMQEAQNDAPAPMPEGAAAAEMSRKKENNEPGEADRALTVVAKKLSKSLSVTATVNELIQQATDERNLAVLFAGWAAYA